MLPAFLQPRLIATENGAYIVCRHRDPLSQMKTVTPGERRHVAEVAYSPLGVLRLKPVVEILVARSGMSTVDPVRSVEIEDAAG